MTKPSHDADVAFIKALAELLTENDLTELEVRRDYGEDDALQVRVTKGGPVQYQAPAPAPAPAQQAAPTPQASSSGSGSGGGAEAPEDPADHPGAVTSPMVGTAYLAAEPGSDPFVRVGSEVKEGQTLLIVEAMKTMNHIPASRSGTVKRVLVEDGAPVEFGAPLMIIE